LLSLVLYAIVARTTFPLFSGLAAGGVVGLAILLFGKTSGGHINPAVTFGLWTARKISTLHAVVNIIMQVLGGLAAWWLLNYFLGRHLQSIAGSKFEWKILIAEALGTAVFTFGLAAAIYSGFDRNKVAGIAALSFVAGVIVASLASNAVLNPAVALGIQSWSWAYAVGPLIGGLVGMNLYSIFFVGKNWPALGGSLSAARATTVKSTRPTSKKPAAKKRK
jgi:aquaporin TIP